jgi:hypothetical protein
MTKRKWVKRQTMTHNILHRKLWPTTYYTEKYDPQHTTQKIMTHNILHRKLWPTTYYTENYDPQHTTQKTMTHNILHRKLKIEQHEHCERKSEKTNYNPQNNTQKTKDWATQTKYRVEFRCSGRVGSNIFIVLVLPT